MADSETRTYLIWNRDSVTTYIRSITFTDDAGVSHHAAFPAGWDGPYANQADFTANTTVISEVTAYVSDIGNVIKQYVSHTGTSLTVSSTASLYVGYTLYGNGYTAGQTITGFGTTATVITSAGPDGSPLVDENILFSPPQYLLRVDSNAGVDAGWIASGNGYSGQTAQSFSSTDYIIMSGGPASTPNPGGTITFTSPQTVLTLAPGTSSTFTARYTNNTAVLGTYPATFTIQAQSTQSITKVVSNFIGINTTPVDPGGGSGDGGWGVVGGGFVGSVTDSEGNAVTDSEGNAVSGGGGAAPSGGETGSDAGTGIGADGMSTDGSGNP